MAKQWWSCTGTYRIDIGYIAPIVSSMQHGHNNNRRDFALRRSAENMLTVYK